MRKGEWVRVEERLPHWNESGPAELRLADGRVVAGEIEIEELWTGEEELPMATFVTGSADPPSIHDAEAWRILPRDADLKELARKHGIVGVTVDPGGRLVRHPCHGEFRLEEASASEDFATIVAFLKKHGIEP